MDSNFPLCPCILALESKLYMWVAKMIAVCGP